MDQIAVALIGFGEAGRSFADAGSWSTSARVFDVLTDDPASADRKRREYLAAGVAGSDRLADAVSRSPLVLSLVTADQAVVAARAAASLIDPATMFCDMNSVAPETKRIAAQAIEAAGGWYVDVAVMAPVNPARLAVPLLLSGVRGSDAAAALERLGFTNIRVVGDKVGQASAIKMIRSVMVKGIEALTAECVLAAERAGVTAEVLGSLGPEWDAKADYNLDRMMVHGLRRAAEMEEVALTLEGLGAASGMTREAVALHRRLGRLGVTPPPAGLPAKIEKITDLESKLAGRADAA